MAEPAVKKLRMEAAHGNTSHIPTETDSHIVLPESEPIALIINTKQQDPSQAYDLISPLKALGYKIFREEEIQLKTREWTNEEIKSIVRAFLVYCTRKNPKSFAVSIGTWGHKYVPTWESSKERIYPWRDIFSKFNTAIPSVLSQIPKRFFTSKHFSIYETMHAWGDIFSKFDTANPSELSQIPKRYFVDNTEETSFEKCMGEENQAIIFEEAQYKLIRQVNAHVLVLARLQERNVISSSEAEAVKKERTDSDRAAKLIEILKTRPNALENFQQTLIREKQSGAAEIIDTEIRNYVLKTMEQFARLRPTSDNSISAHPTAENFADDNSEAGQLKKEYLKEVEKYSPLKISLERPANDMRTTFDKNSHVISNTEKHGALIINVRSFDLNSYRKGSEHDETYMQTVLKELGYTIFREDEYLWENGYWSKDDIVEIVTEFQTHCEDARFQSIVIFIGSHGAHKSIVSSDNREICPWRNIFSKFYDANCPTLKGKPKLFFINACQVFQPEERDDIQIGGDVISDMLCCTSQVPGLPSYRDTESGSWFVHCITYYIMRCAKDKDLLQILDLAIDALKGRRGVMQCEESGTLPSQNATVWTHNLKKKIFFDVKPT